MKDAKEEAKTEVDLFKNQKLAEFTEFKKSVCYIFTRYFILFVTYDYKKYSLL